MELLGFARVPNSAFIFNELTRGEDKDAIRRLDRVYRRTGCRPDDEGNCVIGVVDTKALRKICSAIGVSDDGVRRKLRSQPPPRIDLRRCIICVDGRQRVAAAKRRYGTRAPWWTVKLYFAPRGIF